MPSQVFNGDGNGRVVKCAECNLAGLPLPYDIIALNIERQAIRDQINILESQL